MPTVTKSIEIRAPVEKVFEGCDDPERVVAFFPNVLDAGNIVQSDRRVGDQFELVYDVLGTPLGAEFTTTEYSPPTALSARIDGGIKGLLSFRFAPNGDSTTATIESTYEIRRRAFAGLPNDQILEWWHERSVEQTLENMKRLIELEQELARPDPDEPQPPLRGRAYSRAAAVH